MPDHSNILAVLSGGYAFVGFGTALCGLICGVVTIHGAISRDNSLRILHRSWKSLSDPEPLHMWEQVKFITLGILFLCIGLVALAITLAAK